jgi:hypothetical protein
VKYPKRIAQLTARQREFDRMKKTDGYTRPGSLKKSGGTLKK